MNYKEVLQRIAMMLDSVSHDCSCDEVPADIIENAEEALDYLHSLPEPGGWRPIETADRKTVILAHDESRPGGSIFTAHWDSDEYEYNGWYDDNSTMWDPGHWQPLPAPPGSEEPQPQDDEQGWPIISQHEE